MRHGLSVAAFVVLVSMAYTGIAQLLPQLENHPPAVVELGTSIGPEDLSVAGEGVFEANCAQCHKLGEEGGRCPDLASMGALARDRARVRSEQTGETFSDVDYLVEALCRPGDYLVEGYGDIMPSQGRTLSGGQVLAVVAYLQDQGGTATVRGTDVEPVERFGCVSGAVAEAGVPAIEPVGPPEEVFQEFGCAGCHQIEAPIRALGPPLHDVGSRMTKSELYEALLEPDATLAEGDPPYPPGLMGLTLESNGFYERMTAADYRALVEWLAAQEGIE